MKEERDKMALEVYENWLVSRIINDYYQHLRCCSPHPFLFMRQMVSRLAVATRLQCELFFCDYLDGIDRFHCSGGENLNVQPTVSAYL